MNFTRKLLNRETFIGLFIVSLGGLGSIALGIPILGFFLGPIIQQPKEVWRDVGPVDKFKVGSTVQVAFEYSGQLQWGGSTKYTSAWLRRDSGLQFTAFAVYCTHLGCPVHWLAEPEIFLCPCHGSVFNGNGTVVGGPAPRPLFKYDVRIQNSRVQIKTEPQPLVT
ncbi:MAG TPA: ubiquinol-cytochrome c reductase iron-sulfur subunit [Chloroflexota bacterium]